MSFEIAKAGSVQRLTSVLKRWKKQWLVLYLNGQLKYFASQDSHTAEECIVLPRDCHSIIPGLQNCDKSYSLPDGCTCNSLFTINLRNSSPLVFCAESPDDMSAWHFSLQQAMATQTSNTRPMSTPVPRRQAQSVMMGNTPVVYHEIGGGAPYQPYYTYPGQVLQYGPNGPAQQIQLAPGQTNVIFVRDGQYYRRGPDGTDIALGIMAGAALGSLMWSPFFFF